MNQQLQTHEAETQTLSALRPADDLRQEQTDSLETADQAAIVSDAEQSVSASADRLNALIRHEVRQKRRADYMIMIWAAVFSFIIVYQAREATADQGTLALRLLTTFGFMSAVGFFVCVGIILRATRGRHLLTEELNKSHDVTLTGALIDTLRIENRPVRNLAKHALISRLPTLQASDAALLTDAHRDRLLRLLAISPDDKGYRDLPELFSRSAYRREVDLRVAVLKAFEQVGGAKELPVVERISKGLPTVYSFLISSEVKAAAGECLPFLQARASEQLASEQLLRASSQHDTPSGILLRPAPAQTECAPEQMLRASESGVC